MGEEAKAMDTPPTIGASVIPIMNKLQDILAPVGAELSKISLPQVAVVGSQSSGKSSVLEALVGRDFLPRGCDICTRRPLVLMLENRPRNAADDDDGAEWGEFRHLPGRRFYDFSKIRREIQVLKFTALIQLSYWNSLCYWEIHWVASISGINVANSNGVCWVWVWAFCVCG